MGTVGKDKDLRLSWPGLLNNGGYGRLPHHKGLTFSGILGLQHQLIQFLVSYKLVLFLQFKLLPRIFEKQGILDGRGYFGVKTPAAKACVRFRATFGLRHLTGWWQSGSSIRVATTTVARSFQVRQQSLEILKTELLCVCAS